MFVLRLLLIPVLGASLVATAHAIAQTAAQPDTPSSQTSSTDLAAVRKLIDRGQPKEALRQLDQLAAQQPPLAGVERLRGLALYAEDDFPAADQAFAKALQQDSKD